jgi:hypothetical protein
VPLWRTCPRVAPCFRAPRGERKGVSGCPFSLLPLPFARPFRAALCTHPVELTACLWACALYCGRLPRRDAGLYFALFIQYAPFLGVWLIFGNKHHSLKMRCLGLVAATALLVQVARFSSFSRSGEGRGGRVEWCVRACVWLSASRTSLSPVPEHVLPESAFCVCVLCLCSFVPLPWPGLWVRHHCARACGVCVAE